MQTGFRVGLHSAQGVFGITPDLGTFGKSFAAGLPLGAVAGKRPIMNLLYERRVLGAGTFNGYPFGTAAALACLTILERDNGAIYEKINSVQKILMRGLKTIAAQNGLPALVQGPTGVFIFLVVDKDVAYSPQDLNAVNWKIQSRFEKQMAEEGVLLVRGGRWFVSAAVTEKDVEKALACAERVISSLSKG